MICKEISVIPRCMNGPCANEAAHNIISILKLCQQLLSEKDGRDNKQ